MADTKNKQEKTNSKETHDEQAYSKTSDEAIERIMAGFSEISKEAQKEADEERKKPRFVIKTTDSLWDDHVQDVIRLEDAIEDAGYKVEVLDNLEYKDATTGSKYLIRISNANGVYVSFDLLEYKESIKDWDFDETDFILNKVAKISGDTSSKSLCVAKDIAEYLSILIYFPEKYVKTYNNIGWNYLDGQLIFKYDEIYSHSEWRSECVDDVSHSLVPRYGRENEEDEIKWIDTTIALLNSSAMNSLILGAGISGVIRQLLPYNKENNININIVGERASGKSTICHYVISTFGDPAKLEGSFVDTSNKVDEIRAKRSVLPYVLDERMLRIEENSDLARKRAIIMDIFREYEGKVKERVGKQYDKISGERTCGPIISSSVRSIMDEIYDYVDLGQFRRFIELRVKPSDLFATKDKAEEAELVAETCYGYGIRLVINYLLDYIFDDADYVVERYDYLNKYTTEVLEKFNINDIMSSSSRFSLILLSYEILRESLLAYFKAGKAIRDADEDADDARIEKIIPDKTVDILKILTNNVIAKMQRVSESKKKKSELYEYVKKYSTAFFGFSGKDVGWTVQNGKNVPYIGKIKTGKQSIEIIVKQSYRIEQILFRFNGEIPDPSQIRKYIDLCESGTKAPDTATMFNKLKGIEAEQIDEFLALNEWITVSGRDKQINRYFGKGNKERALVILIDLTKIK